MGEKTRDRKIMKQRNERYVNELLSLLSVVNWARLISNAPLRHTWNRAFAGVYESYIFFLWSMEMNKFRCILLENRSLLFVWVPVKYWIKSHLLYEPEYVVPCVCNLWKEKSCKILSEYVESKFLTAVVMKGPIFCDTMQCSTLKISGRFEVSYKLLYYTLMSYTLL
jgi:hypothetical protein